MPHRLHYFMYDSFVHFDLEKSIAPKIRDLLGREANMGANTQPGKVGKKRPDKVTF
jgi:hypothetical protein